MCKKKVLAVLVNYGGEQVEYLKLVLKELKAVHSQSEQKLKSFDTNMMKMREEFLNMLPKS